MSWRSVWATVEPYLNGAVLIACGLFALYLYAGHRHQPRVTPELWLGLVMVVLGVAICVRHWLAGRRPDRG